MSNTATRVLESTKEFNATDSSGAELDSVFKSLKKASLGHAEFNLAKQAATRLVNSPAVKLFNSVEDNAAPHPRDRRLRVMHGYMATYMEETKDKNAKEPECKGLVIPIIHRFDLDWRDGFNIIRGMPLCVDAGRVEFDFIRSTSSPLRYGGDDMLFAVLFSLPLAQSLSSRFVSGKERIPIAVPFSKGLFLGVAERHLPDSGEELIRMWKVKRTSSIGSGKPSASIAGSVEAKAGIYLNKAIGFRDFKPWHARAYDLLDPIRNDEFRRGRLQRGLEAYSLGPEYKKRMSDYEQWKWGEVAERITKAVDTLYVHLGSKAPAPEGPINVKAEKSGMPVFR